MKLNAYDKLASVLCDPEGNPSIRGSAHDNVIIHDALEEVKLLVEIARKSRVFFDDVMPQIGGLCIQDFANVNELAMAMTELEKGL
jgi:hypothetical protein